MISVFVPSHITGFFSIFDNGDPLLKGSLGAGVLLDKGVITEIERHEEVDSNGLSILINGKKDEYNEVIILKTIELMDNELNNEESIMQRVQEAGFSSNSSVVDTSGYEVIGSNPVVYESQTNWFDRVCEFISSLFGG